jgi:nucleoside-diphosphate-sugar epimerase
MSSQTILVTGAAGYLASWIVEKLLAEGHRVHATVRQLNDVAKIQHLQQLAKQYPGQLHLFAADLLQEQSFDAAMANCTGVIHSASPFFLEKPKNIQQELIQPALHGTLNLLASVNRHPSVRRVVLTSSIVALYNDARDLAKTAAHTVQESDRNQNQQIEHNTYAYSKTIAEKAAWDEFNKQSHWDLITLHPGAMFGPSLSRRTDASSVKMMIQFLNGSFRAGVPKLWLGIVDVRDVAAAHVRAINQHSAKHRYILVAESLKLLEISQRMNIAVLGIKDRLPKAETAKALIWLIAPWIGMSRAYVARNVGYPIYFNHARSQSELGLQYRNPSDTLNEHIAQIVADGLLDRA